MWCEKFERRMQMLLDARQRPEFDDELQSHAWRCEACRRNLAAQEKLFEGLDLFDPPDAPPDFALNVVAQLTVSRPSTWRRVVRFGAIAVAASLLLVFVPTFREWLSSRAEPEPSAPIARSRHAAPTTIAMAHQPPSRRVAPAVQDGSPAPATIAQAAPPESANAEQDTTPALQVADARREPLSILDELRESLSSVSAEPLESVDQITESFRPLASSLQAAINVLWRSLPIGNDQRNPKAAPDTSYMADRDWIA